MSLDDTSLNLSNRVTLSSNSTAVLDFEGNASADVDLSNVGDCIISGNINGGGAPYGTHTFAFYGACGTWVVGQVMAMGNGNKANDAFSLVQNGTIYAITMSTLAASTGTAELYVNGVASGLTMSLAASTTVVSTGNVSFSAGQTISVRMTAGAGLNDVKIVVVGVYDP